MAKRFIDTGMFDDVWFMDLSKDAKILWLYFITKCDHAGILKLNVKLCQIQTGLNKLNEIVMELGNRIVKVNEQIYFIPKFLEFQYPGFPECKFKAARSALEILVKYDLVDNHGNVKLSSNSSVSVTEVLPNTYGNGISIGNGNGIGKTDEMEKEKKPSLKQRKLDLIEQRKELFFQRVAEFKDQYPADMISQFCDYWTETNKSGSQMRWEMQTTWEFSKRLANWFRRSTTPSDIKPKYHATDF